MQLGFVDDLKEMFQVKTWENALYLVAGGYAGGILGSIFGRMANGDKWAQWLGYISGGAVASYIIKKFFNNDAGARSAMVGSIVFPLWEVITDKINPEEIANKAAMTLGLPWSQGVTMVATASAPAPVPTTAPVTVTVAPAPVGTAPAAPVEEEHLF
ncbi:MAG: hypothetical protein J7L37_04625 [Thermococcus sp.]|nr:hypothetical protein [Thermococcus sp.]